MANTGLNNTLLFLNASFEVKTHRFCSRGSVLSGFIYIRGYLCMIHKSVKNRRIINMYTEEVTGLIRKMDTSSHIVYLAVRNE